MHGVVHAPHRDHAYRAPGAVHEHDGLREVILEAVLVDRVGVPAAHLHELVLAPGLAKRRYLRGERTGLLRVTIFVHEPHCPHATSRLVIPAAPRSRPHRLARCPRGTAWPPPPRFRRSSTRRSRHESAPTHPA